VRLVTGNILDYSNPLYEETVVSQNPLTGQEQKDVVSPQHPESGVAFARWAAAAAKHFAGRRIIWEIWNEPNISFWKPQPDVAQYTALAPATAKAVRAADPGATFIGPATSGVPVKFIEQFFAGGALAHLDAVSVHPYRSVGSCAKSPIHFSGVKPPSLSRVTFVHGLPGTPLAAAIQSSATCLRESGKGRGAPSAPHSLRSGVQRESQT